MSRIFLLILAGLKFGKLFGTVGTMLIAIGVYAIVFGWRYAIGIVAMLFVHEMGHYLAARQRGLAVRLPMFIPFAFAWTRLEDTPHDAETEAYIGLAGPMLGTVGAIAAYGLAGLVVAVAAHKLGFLALAGALFAKFAKLIFIGLAVFGGGVMRFFKRTPRTTPVAPSPAAPASAFANTVAEPPAALIAPPAPVDLDLGDAPVPPHGA